jgi:hypothetical protein
VEGILNATLCHLILPEFCNDGACTPTDEVDNSKLAERDPSSVIMSNDPNDINEWGNMER